jgi:AraC-like DNA-binding protein
MSRAARSATIRVGNVGSIPAVFRSLGLDLDAALTAVGLAASIFDDPESFVPYVAIDELFRLAVRESGCEHFGLLVGMAPPNLGLPGFLMQHAPTVRIGLQNFVASMNRVDGGAVVGLVESGGVATLSYSVMIADVRSVHHVCDTAMAVGLSILRRVIDDFSPIEIRLPRGVPGNLAPYKAFFTRGRLKFDSHEAAIDFPAACLDAPIRNADPALYRYLKHLFAQESDCAEFTMAEQIRRILPNLIRHKEVNNKTVSQMFGVHPRTMARRLAEESVTLNELVQEARFEVAQQLLRATDLALTEIAADLFYSDASAFTRAFRRKFGMTPGSWRKEKRRNETEFVRPRVIPVIHHAAIGGRMETMPMAATSPDS